MSGSQKTALIFGISGQDGAYLAKLLLEKGYNVVGTSRDAEQASLTNLRELDVLQHIAVRSAVPFDFRSVVQVVKSADPCEIYNLAAQSSVGLSFDQPAETLQSMMNGTLNILEAIRMLKSDAKFYNASSSECFGSTIRAPADEKTAFNPCSPYGVGKAAAHWLVANYRDAYGLHACSGILFNHESPMRPARFVTQKVIRGALDIAEGKAKRLQLGNLAVRRDWGWAPEYVEAMWLMMQTEVPQDFVVATGIETSLEDFVASAFSNCGLDWRAHVDIEPSLHRPSDIAYSVGNPALVRERLGWEAKCRMPELTHRLVEAEVARRSRSPNRANSSEV